MTIPLSAKYVSLQVEVKYPGAVTALSENVILTGGRSLRDVMAFLKNTPGLDFNYMTAITAVDYFQYFEVIYFLVSMEHNHSLTVKTRVNRDNASLPSVVDIWHSADYQEREIFDLMGITFEGHPNMKRIVLWPEFAGHPQRRDFLK